jgi:hypothetical protein
MEAEQAGGRRASRPIKTIHFHSSALFSPETVESGEPNVKETMRVNDLTS